MPETSQEPRNRRRISGMLVLGIVLIVAIVQQLLWVMSDASAGGLIVKVFTLFNRSEQPGAKFPDNSASVLNLPLSFSSFIVGS